MSSVGQDETRTQKRIPAWFTRGTQFDRDLEPQRIHEFTRVTYRLYKDFPEEVISTQDRSNKFGLWLNVYGEFTVVAYAERDNAAALANAVFGPAR